ncbi:sugar transferase [Pandoraea faecigallinarum]|uniref:Sugar transferase n=1 Tax=Pandoraea faecigallinarum TaxID=656179 RepID=A0A0H3WS30_9BURK|nr:sugar transferase [Pandoraea faecigallinarum]AKM30425.1 sugar transferase [Pandoraea faecigallinarum]
MSSAKRLLDLAGSSAGLLVLSPVLLGIALAVKLDSPGPVFFRQERIGLRGVPFRIHKFRTMTVDMTGAARQITVGADRRITRVGSVLRKYKLDELAQLIDVFTGAMSLVGPRPEVPKYVAVYPSDVRDIVLSVKPGITDLASIEYRDESTLLGQSDDPERTYIEEVLPAKLRYCVEYAQRHSVWLDVRIILRTIKAIVT